MILSQAGSLAIPTPNLQQKLCCQGRPRRVGAQRQEGLALEVLSSVGQQRLLQGPIPFSHLSLSHWRTVAYIFISCQIRVLPSWETTGGGGEGLRTWSRLRGCGGDLNPRSWDICSIKLAFPCPPCWVLCHPPYPRCSLQPRGREAVAASQMGWGPTGCFFFLGW